MSKLTHHGVEMEMEVIAKETDAGFLCRVADWLDTLKPFLNGANTAEKLREIADKVQRVEPLGIWQENLQVPTSFPYLTGEGADSPVTSGILDSVCLGFFAGVRVWEKPEFNVATTAKLMIRLNYLEARKEPLQSYPKAMRSLILNDIKLNVLSSVRSKFGAVSKWDIAFLRQPEGVDMQWTQEEVSMAFGSQCEYQPRPLSFYAPDPGPNDQQWLRRILEEDNMGLSTSSDPSEEKKITFREFF